ncbi:MAG: Ppx/GppA phosphatase family protein [Rickettsiales bacterium]|nr:Ppx/GppA phosphatase family protein [Rickettsiales bacterium]
MLPSSQDMRVRGKESNVESQVPICAALDLGTNNCRLLIASYDASGQSPGIKVYDSFSRIVRLGEGLSVTGELSDEAMERTLVALKACQKKLDKYNIVRSRFVATEACRRAKNGRHFIDRVCRETGIAIDIISTEEEARLAFMGCSSLLADESKRAVVFDIGGGSTELMWIDVEQVREGAHAHTITDWLSIGYGVMNLADKFGGSTFADMAFDDMVRFLVDKLRPFDEANHISKAIGGSDVQLLSTSGTVTTLAAIHLDLPRYDRSRIDGITLAISDIRATTQKLLKMRPSERFHHPCIGSDRADFIISGCAIFEAISTVWPAGHITIADRGVREGIILSLLKS